MENFDIHVLKSKSINIAFHPESLAMFHISEKIARILELYENLNNISELARILEITENEIQGVLGLFNNEIKNLSYKASKDKNDVLSELVLFITHSCNFQCRYCCAQGLYRKNPHMDLETGRKAIATFLRLYPNNVKTIVFFGGEPLLKFEVVRDLVKFTFQFCHANQIEMPRFGIVTNGSLLNSKVINFLKKYEIMTTVSLDGPSVVNDFQRIFPSGEGTHHIIVNRIKELRRTLHNFNIEVTVTRKTIESGFSVRDILLYSHALGAKVSHITPVCGPNEEVALPQDYAQSIANSFKEAALYTMQSLLTENPVWLQYVCYILESLITKIPKKYLCFAGLGALTVFPNGDVYPCYFLMDDRLLMGNIFDSNFPGERFFRVKKLLLENAKDRMAPCKWCWARNICHSCYGFEFSLSNSLSAPPKMFCLIQKAMIEAVLLKLAEFRMDSKLWPKIINTLQTELADEKPLGEKGIPIQEKGKRSLLDP